MLVDLHTSFVRAWGRSSYSGIKPISPLDVLDIVLMHRKEGAFILDTWTL